jgi:outer membrane receptor protein involved in Fe transport
LVRDYGLPGYTVFDVRGGYSFNRNLRMTLAMENIFNKLYRTAHSRMDAQGRNLLVSMEYKF